MVQQTEKQLDTTIQKKKIISQELENIKQELKWTVSRLQGYKREMEDQPLSPPLQGKVGDQVMQRTSNDHRQREADMTMHCRNAIVMQAKEGIVRLGERRVEIEASLKRQEKDIIATFIALKRELERASFSQKRALVSDMTNLLLGALVNQDSEQDKNEKHPDDSTRKACLSNNAWDKARNGGRTSGRSDHDRTAEKCREDVGSGVINTPSTSRNNKKLNPPETVELLSESEDEVEPAEPKESFDNQVVEVRIISLNPEMLYTYLTLHLLSVET